MWRRLLRTCAPRSSFLISFKYEDRPSSLLPYSTRPAATRKKENAGYRYMIGIAGIAVIMTIITTAYSPGMEYNSLRSVDRANYSIMTLVPRTSDARGQKSISWSWSSENSFETISKPKARHWADMPRHSPCARVHQLRLLGTRRD